MSPPAKKKNCDSGYACKLSCISQAKSCLSPLEGAAKERVSWLAHQADHLAENVGSWKVGKLVGGAIAEAAVAHGAPVLVTHILAETAVQAATATAIHYAKHPNSTPKDLAAHFVQQAAAAFLGKDAHFFADEGMHALEASALYEQIVPIVSGKVTGIGTATGLKRSGLDRRLVDEVVDRSKADLAKVRAFFDRAGNRVPRQNSSPVSSPAAGANQPVNQQASHWANWASYADAPDRDLALECEAIGRLVYESLILAVAARAAA